MTLFISYHTHSSYMEPLTEPSFRYMPMITKLPLNPTTNAPSGSIHTLVSCLPRNDTNPPEQVAGHGDLLMGTIDDAQFEIENQDMKPGLTQSCVFADQPDSHSFSILEDSNQTVSLAQHQGDQKTANNPPR